MYRRFPSSRLPLLTVTQYFPESFMTTFCVVAPFDHRYEVNPAPASSVTLSPAQNGIGPRAVIVGESVGETETVTLSDTPVQPPAALTLT